MFRVVFFASLLAVPSIAWSDVRATYGVNGKTVVVVDVKNSNTMRVSPNGSNSYYLWDGKEISQISRQDGKETVVRSVDLILATEIVKGEVAELGYLAESIPRREPVDLRTGEVTVIEEFSGRAFDLDVIDERKPVTLNFVSSPDPRLKVLAQASEGYHLREFDIDHLPFSPRSGFTDMEMSQKIQNLRDQYVKIYSAGAPLIWPNNNRIKLIRVDNVDLPPKHYVPPASPVSVKELAHSMMNGIRAQMAALRK